MLNEAIIYFLITAAIFAALKLPIGTDKKILKGSVIQTYFHQKHFDVFKIFCEDTAAYLVVRLKACNYLTKVMLPLNGIVMLFSHCTSII